MCALGRNGIAFPVHSLSQVRKFICPSLGVISGNLPNVFVSFVCFSLCFWDFSLYVLTLVCFFVSSFGLLDLLNRSLYDRGQLPRPYEAVNGTWVIPPDMNDMNREEVSRYVRLSLPGYLFLFQSMLMYPLNSRMYIFKIIFWPRDLIAQHET